MRLKDYLMALARHIPVYSTKCIYREIPPDELLVLRECLNQRFGVEMHCHQVESVRPEVFKWDLSPSWTKFNDLWGKHRGSFRRFTFYFYGGKRSDSSSIDRIQFGLQVVMRRKFGAEADRRIRLSGIGCERSDYERFVGIATSVLHLRKAPPAGMDWDDVALDERVSAGIINADLVDAISGALGARRYEEAMQNAVILVESKLREKCLSAGGDDAQNATGNNLAVIAYHPDTGCLRPPWPVAVNADQGVMQLFMGFIQYLRNAFGHNALVMGGDKSSVFELLAFCEFLLAIIEKSTKR